jgi:hypothetical protein
MITSVKIKSKSHSLDNNSFTLFERMGTNFSTEIIDKSLFKLVWTVSENSKLFNEFHDHHCYVTFSAMLASLNIVSLGLFSWHDGVEISPIYERKEHNQLVALTSNHHQKYESLRKLSEQDVHDAVIIFGAICREKEEVVVSEYLKGIMHLSMSYYEINFHREAFGNFYRVIEYIVTNRFLKKRKLSSELKDITKVLSDLGADETLLTAFRNVYIKRGSQVMHAQLQPETIDFEEVTIVKTFCDLLLNKYYRGIADEWLNLRKSS